MVGGWARSIGWGRAAFPGGVGEPDREEPSALRRHARWKLHPGQIRLCGCLVETFGFLPQILNSLAERSDGHQGRVTHRIPWTGSEARHPGPGCLARFRPRERYRAVPGRTARKWRVGGVDCAACGAHNPDDSRFCGSCGSALVPTVICGVCNSTNADTQRFCIRCGSPLEAGMDVDHGEREGERRHLTVMFTDLVNSTQLAEELDPEEMREVILGYQELVGGIIERNHGYIAHYMGDGILSYFGFPAAHEDDAESAVRAGLEISGSGEQLRVRFHRNDMHVRVGVHAGEVVVGAMGASGSRKQAFDVIGDTPNVAARLQGAAEPYEVVISATTHNLVTGLLSVVPLGEIRLRDVSPTSVSERPGQCRR